jgi:hypothetical protein
MKRGLALLTLIVLCNCFLSTEPLNENPEHLQATVDNSAAVQLLDASYVAANKLDPSERVFYLTYLTVIAADIDTQRTKAWCNELFSIAFRMSIGHDRTATEKNALMQLSKFDPQSALDRLPQVEDPQPDPTGDFPEDVRADAAITIFPNYWHAPGADVPTRLKQIKSVAKHIGDTGEYPYRAMGLIIKELVNTPGDSARTEANGILEEAIRSYQRKEEFKFDNRREEFLRILQNARTLVSGDLYKQALRVFVSQILADTSRKENFAAKIRTSKGTEVSFDSSNRAFLFRAYPLIDQVDHAWAQELVHTYSELAQADGEITSVKANVVLGTPTPEQVERSYQEMLQKDEIQQIRDLQKTDPQAALAKARALSNSSIRINCLSLLLANAAQSNPASTKNIFRVVKVEIDALKESSEKLEGMVALATIAFHTQNTNVFSELADTILSQGATMFDQSPTVRANRRPGFSELAQATEFYTSWREDWFVDRIQNLQNETLKAYLLMHAAKGTAVAESRKGLLFPR